MYDKICYKNNNIVEVILRLDLANIIMELRNSMPKEINDVVKKYFPIAEPEGIIGTEFQIIPGFQNSNTYTNQKKWVFYSRDRKQRCSIEETNIIFSVKNYDVYEEFRNTALEIIDIISKKYSDVSIKRLGFRFINQVKLDGRTDYIDSTVMDSFKQIEGLQRAITTIEYVSVNQDYSVRKQYGYINPDYPSVMQNEIFLIDIDAYTSGLVYFEEIEGLVDNMHEEIQSNFENTITDELRKEMNNA